jgi:hypothetical protein
MICNQAFHHLLIVLKTLFLPDLSLSRNSI